MTKSFSFRSPLRPASTATAGRAARSSGTYSRRYPALLLTQQLLGFVLLVGGLETHGHIRDRQNVFFLTHQKLHVGGHTRLKEQFFIIDSYHGVISDHILQHGGRMAHLVNRSLKTARRKGVDGESHRLPFVHIAD